MKETLQPWSDDDEFAAVLTAAAEAISSGLRDGKVSGKHAAGSYRLESIEHQLRHIEAHITAHQCGDRSEDHLAHIVCRAAFAVALRIQEAVKANIICPR